ncbi:Transcriptional regulator TetR family [Patulibacter medicamentivorans]|uniref:Transcriptional regulator TetR family n=1 Tax=Patulibacter medicamentivorans TaxID=1097667 RepID=H0E2J3_9ACTN|nr:TetR family transcriptional regulator C-terminal domain-containing protein [Patulibacter medicamentivorans]EHN12103.1 Transcriptional regulator TetR family [Patulibacter medicamentivorans]
MSGAPRTRLTFAERRAEILDAAARVIVAQGLHAFRIRDVADEAGVSQPLVSTHFRSREELILEAFVRADERSLQTLIVEEDASANGHARVVAFLHGCVSADAEPDDGLELWHQVWTHATFSTAIHEAVRTRQAAWIRHLAGLIEAGQQDGSVARDVDPERVALFLITVVDGLAPSLRSSLIDRARAGSVVDDAVAAMLGPAA